MIPIILVTGIIGLAYLYKRNEHYYHGSDKPLKIGKVIIAKKHKTEFSNRKSKDGINVEKFVSLNRPNGSLQREKTIFTVSDLKDLNLAGASEKYIYEVKSLGKTQNAHFSWISKLLGYSYDHNIRNSKYAKRIARNYYDKPKGTKQGIGAPENLHEAVQIVRRIK